MSLRWMVLVQILVMSLGLSVTQAASESDAELAKHFTVSWSSIRYSKTVVIENPAGAARPSDQAVSENLSLSCEIVIREPNLILGTCSEVVVTEVTGVRRQSLDVTPPGLGRRPGSRYEGLRYRKGFQQPPKPPRWRKLLRSALQLSPDKLPRPQLVSQLEPSHVNVRLDKALLEKDVREVRSIKGYFHVLTAESLAHVEVPFEPNDNWVRLTPDLEILVRQASCEGSSYRYRIETSPRGGPMRRFSPADTLPGRFVVAQQLIGADGKPTRRSSPFGHLPAHIGGNGSGGGGNRPITAIRYVIAVNPSHRKVPFELTDIPLPDPAGSP